MKIKRKYVMPMFLIGLAAVILIFTFGIPVPDFNEELELIIPPDIITTQDLLSTNFIQTESDVLYIILPDWAGALDIQINTLENSEEGISINIQDGADTYTIETSIDLAKLFIQTGLYDDRVAYQQTSPYSPKIQKLICLLGNGHDSCTVTQYSPDTQIIVLGEEGDDTIEGYENYSVNGGGYQGRHVFIGGDGRDMLLAEGTHNVLIGSSDDDSLYCRRQSFQSLADDSDNVLIGGMGNDYLESKNYMGSVLIGGGGNDVLKGIDLASEIMIGGTEWDTLWGGPGYDILHGGEMNDTLYGQDGKDILLGGGAHDTLYGGGENDILIGGWGTDTLYGGPGNDLERQEYY